VPAIFTSTNGAVPLGQVHRSYRNDGEPVALVELAKLGCKPGKLGKLNKLNCNPLTNKVGVRTLVATWIPRGGSNQNP